MEIDNSSADEAKTSTRSKLRRVAVAVASALILGAAGSGLWEMLFKPGLGRLGRFLLNLATLGSVTIRDFAYQSAALDPTPLASLQLIVLLAQVPLFLIVLVMTDRPMRRIVRSRLARKAVAGGRKEPYVAYRIRTETLYRRLRLLIIGLNLLISLYTLTAAAVLNQAVIVYRVFHTDLAICRPHLSNDEWIQLLSRFASMRSKADYEALHERLAAVAKAANRRLVSTDTW